MGRVRVRRGLLLIFYGCFIGGELWWWWCVNGGAGLFGNCLCKVAGLELRRLGFDVG